MTFMTEVDPVVTEGSLLADETSKEEQLKAAAERINNAELTERVSTGKSVLTDPWPPSIMRPPI